MARSHLHFLKHDPLSFQLSPRRLRSGSPTVCGAPLTTRQRSSPAARRTPTILPRPHAASRKQQRTPRERCSARSCSRSHSSAPPHCVEWSARAHACARARARAYVCARACACRHCVLRRAFGRVERHERSGQWRLSMFIPAKAKKSNCLLEAFPGSSCAQEGQSTPSPEELMPAVAQ